ncbi:MAG: amidohydrolase [Acholeplasmataceae bacterium]
MILWHNATFHTLDENQPNASEMITNNGRIVEIGDNLNRESVTKAVDLNNTHVYPGFVDSHLHIIGYGQKLNRFDVTGITNKKELLAFLREQQTAHSFIFAEGYQNLGVTALEIDSVVNDKWVLLRHRDYHALTVNTKVIEDLNLNSATGILLETAAEDVIKKMPSYTQLEIEKMLETSISHLYRFGLTGGHSDDMRYFNGYHSTIEAYKTVLAKTPFRVNLLLAHEELDNYEKDEQAVIDENIRLDATKLFFDGTFGSKTALMFDPYRNSNDCGVRIFKEGALVDLIKRIRLLELTVAVHVIGDKGLDELLTVLKKYPPKQGQFDRIIHASALAQKTIDDYSPMPIMIDAQPQFLVSDLPEIKDNFSKIPQYLYPFKTYQDLKITLAFGSDAPIEEPNPLLGIYAAVTRTGKDNKIYNENERITRYEAILGYTVNAAKIGNSTNSGKLKVGYRADLSAFKLDLLKAPIEELLRDQVYLTVINEQIVYPKK